MNVKMDSIFKVTITFGLFLFCRISSLLYFNSLLIRLYIRTKDETIQCLHSRLVLQGHRKSMVSSLGASKTSKTNHTIFIIFIFSIQILIYSLHFNKIEDFQIFSIEICYELTELIT